MEIIRNVLATKLTWCLLLLFTLASLQLLPPTSNANSRHSIVIGAQDDDAAEIELQKGTDLLRRRSFEDALKSFKRANELRAKKCGPCLYGMTQAYLGMDAHKSAAETADKLIAAAAEDKQLLRKAYNVKGLSLQEMSKGKDQKKLTEAEATFRNGLALDTEGELPILHYNLGYILMQLNRDPEGIAEMKKFLEVVSEGDYAETAARVIANPRRAREPYAPDFLLLQPRANTFPLKTCAEKL